MNYEKPNPLPKGWETKTIEEFVENGRSIGYGVLKPGSHVEGGVRLIKSNQVQDGWVNLANDYRISPELDQEFKRTRLSGGELLLNVVGSIGRKRDRRTGVGGVGQPPACRASAAGGFAEGIYGGTC